MRLKTHFLLATVISTLLCLPAPACSHDDRAKSGSEVDWNSFKPIEMQGLRSSSLEELGEQAGFQVVLPSYLPEGMSKTFLLSSQDIPVERGRAFIGLAPTLDSGAPTMQIDENLRDPSGPEPKYGSGFEVSRIGQTDIGCSIHITSNGELQAVGRTPPPGGATRDPELYPNLSCEWADGDLEYLLQFAWKLPEPVPGSITPEMREEAMKVIASMIENPYIVDSSSS